MQIGEFQELIDRMYSDRDRERGTPGTFMWLIEEVGELASALAEGTPMGLREPGETPLLSLAEEVGQPRASLLLIGDELVGEAPVLDLL